MSSINTNNCSNCYGPLGGAGASNASGPNAIGAARVESYAASLRRSAAIAGGGTSETSVPERIDRVELSEQARAFASAPTPIRQGLVDRIRAEIESGTYDIDGKLDKAVNELAKDLSDPIVDALGNVYA